MPLTNGTRIGSYEVTGSLGAGGMGEVYQARDTKLDRDVALKVLPEGFTSDPDRLARFEREAKVLASLNHTNIGHIYGLEEAEGTRALVLELVEGPTLADRIAKGPIPVDEALWIARQIAEALEAAHAQGIIHRDLKPANVKVRPDGTVKVLDFGLAKALDTTPESDPAESPTMTAVATRAGIIMGTAAYMSPEQARAKSVDSRADVWALGAVLFEMLSGKRPFDGRDVSEVLGAVLRLEPDWDAISIDTPPRIRALLRRCLEKEPRQRVQAVGDVRLAIDGGFELDGDEAPRANGPSRFRLHPVAALIGVLVLAGLAWLTARVFTAGVTSEAGIVRFGLAVPDEPANRYTERRRVAFAPNGDRIVYAGGDQLYVRGLDQLQFSSLAGTEGAIEPLFSRDGRSIAFWADGRLQSVPVAGGTPVTLADSVAPFGASRAADDTILFNYPRTGISRVPAAGGVPAVVVAPTGVDDIAFRRPQLLPDGEWVLSGEWPSGRAIVQSLVTGERQMVIEERVGDVRYVATGHLLYMPMGSGTLLAAPFDLETRTLSGPAVPMVEGILQANNGIGHIDVADNGSLVYLAGQRSNRPRESTLVLVDRQGDVRELPVRPDIYVVPRLSPDDSRIAVHVGIAGESDIWIYDIATNRMRQLTFDGGAWPVWSPDGSRVSFIAGESVWTTASDFTKEPEVLGPRDEALGTERLYAWHPNGNVLLTAVGTVGGIAQFTRRDGERPEHQVLVDEPGNQWQASFSADGRWFSYSSEEDGIQQVYIQPYPPGSGNKQRITEQGGSKPVWSRNGREIFYEHDGQLWTVGIMETDPALDWQDPEPLFDAPWAASVGAANWDASSDGAQFVFVQPVDDVAAPQVTVIVNWVEELKARVPVN